jgi:hypothetical protein
LAASLRVRLQVPVPVNVTTRPETEQTALFDEVRFTAPASPVGYVYVTVYVDPYTVDAGVEVMVRVGFHL